MTSLSMSLSLYNLYAPILVIADDSEVMLSFRLQDLARYGRHQLREILEFFEVEDGSDDGLPPTINLVGIAIILAILVVE